MQDRRALHRFTGAGNGFVSSTMMIFTCGFALRVEASW
jgi:hypothetical protein